MPEVNFMATGDATAGLSPLLFLIMRRLLRLFAGPDSVVDEMDVVVVGLEVVGEMEEEVAIVAGDSEEIFDVVAGLAADSGVTMPAVVDDNVVVVGAKVDVVVVVWLSTLMGKAAFRKASKLSGFGSVSYW